jgi:hypothetical protein
LNKALNKKENEYKKDERDGIDFKRGNWVRIGGP